MTRLAALALAAGALLACNANVVSSSGTTSGATTTTTGVTTGTAAGGAGGAGGGSSVGGAGGSVTTTGAGGAPGTIVEVPCACPGQAIAWAWIGGYVQWNDATKVAGCASLELTRTMAMGGTPGDPPRVCTDDVAACGADGLVTTDALAQAIAQPDVKAALELAKGAASPPLYGFDMRPTDGQLLELTVDGATIHVGYPCGEQPGCAPIPKGIDFMQTKLRVIDDAVRGEATCATTLAGKK